jgi:hypothetical protein
MNRSAIPQRECWNRANGPPVKPFSLPAPILLHRNTDIETLLATIKDILCAAQEIHRP